MISKLKVKLLGTMLLTTALLSGCSINQNSTPQQFTISTNDGHTASLNLQSNSGDSLISMRDANGIEYNFENPDYSLYGESVQMVNGKVSSVDYRVIGAGNIDDFTVSVEVGSCHELLFISLDDSEHKACGASIFIEL